VSNLRISSVQDIRPSKAPEAHLTSKVLMVRPVKFGFNEETAANNAFQTKGAMEGQSSVQDLAKAEFDGFVALLKATGVDVIAVDDTPEPHTPDSIFPNNWFSTHSTGELVLYPMFAPNRRRERKNAPISAIKEAGKSSLKKTIDFTTFEAKGQFLEGTGSMVLDRANKIVFACKSQRTFEEPLAQFCQELGYSYFYFGAADRSGGPIYHTNVMMCMGDSFAVACLDSIHDETEKKLFIDIVNHCGKEIIDISIGQMEQFAGNMLQLKNKDGQSLLVMSETAKESLEPTQIAALERYCKIVAPTIKTIEINGGGSARCMIAEIFF